MHLLAKYGVALTFEAPILQAGSADFAASGDWTPAAGDVKVSKDGGNVANIGTLPTAVGGTGSVLWTWTLSATEMQAAQITIQVVDSATKAVDDQCFIVQTYGNASAQHAMDFDDSVRGGLTALPNAAADAAGGLPISDAGGLDLDAIATGLVVIDANVDAILLDTNELQTDDVPGLIAALNDLSAAQVNAEVVDVLFTDTISELSQAQPSATPTIATAVMLPYMTLRNKLDTTASLLEVHNDAGTVIAKKTLSDNGTTYSEAKMATGP